MGVKVNPMLAKLEANLESRYRMRLNAHQEMDAIAMLISAHNQLKVGPGRATDLLAEYLDVKMKIAQALLDDVGDSHKKGGSGDPEFLHTRRDLAVAVKDILGEKSWKEYQDLFPICRYYWDKV